MFACPYCGHEIISNSVFCTYCGAILDDSTYRKAKCIVKNPSSDIERDKGLSLHVNDFLENGRYQIIDYIGLGGEAIVYLGQDTRTHNLCAIKEKSKDYNKFALEEINALSKLQHPSIPRIYDYFTEADYIYVVEEYIAGQNLSQYVRIYGSFPETTIYPIAIKLCDVLKYLSSNGIVHGDIKPSNIMLSENIKDIFLIDFGSNVQIENSETNIALATIPFSAPEVLNTNTISLQSDIYSFGVLLFYLCTGEINISKLNSYSANISYGLKSVIKKCTKEYPYDRYQSYSALSSDLLLLSNGELPQAALSTKRIEAIPKTSDNYMVEESCEAQFPTYDESKAPNKRNVNVTVILIVLLLSVVLLMLLVHLSMFPAADIHPTYLLGPFSIIMVLLAISAIIGIIINLRKSKDSVPVSQSNDICPIPPCPPCGAIVSNGSSTVEPFGETSVIAAFKVFISYKQEVNGNFTRDYYMAQDLYHKLSLLGINAFFSPASMKQHGDPSFESAIHDALESSEIFVAVGSDKFHMNSRWVKYERETFHAMMMSGVKGEKAGIYSYIAPDFSVSDLPPMLSSYNAYTDVNQLVDMIATRLNGTIRSSMPDSTEIKKHNMQRVDSELIPGCLIASRYLLLEQKKEGSYYKLFKALDRTNGAKRLIKVINRYAVPDDFRDPERDLLNTISCSGIPTIYEYRDSGPDYNYTVMDYYNGINLETLHRAIGRQDRTHLLQWVINLCDILYILHEQDGGFVHCNIKPSNIFIEEDGSLKLINFSSACRNHSSPSADRSTQAISMMYAAPEQLLPGGVLDVRTDIYAVGCTMLTMLTDVSRIFPLFFTPESFGISRDLSEIICKCMRPNPDERYQSDFELLNDLKLAIQDKYVCRKDINHLIDFTSHIRMQPSQTLAEQTLLISS